MKWIMVFASLFLSLRALAYFESISKDKAPAEMNGIRWSAYSDFAKKWKLVTVRYREDSKEIRLTYANDKAWAGLQKLKPEYVDGAAFAKVAFVTEEDPAFLSSRVPSRSKRYQLMIRDGKKYRDTDGWGYALFDSAGGIFSDDAKVATLACAACHRIVPERAYVFSRPVQFEFDPKQSEELSQLAADHKSIVTFRAKKASDFPKAVEYFTSKDESVESLEGELQQHGFSGTLDEVVPILLDRAKKLSRSSMLALNGENFSLVRRDVSDKAIKCEKTGESAYRVVVVFNNGKVRDTEMCR